MRSLAACALLLVPACAAAAPRPAAPEPGARLVDYRARFAGVPPGAGRVVLRVALPGDAQPVSASVLVGNAVLDCPLDAEPVERASAHAEVAWAPDAGRELSVSTHGKALELTVRLVRPAGGGASDEELERALRLGTRVEVDGRAADGLVARLERAP